MLIIVESKRSHDSRRTNPEASAAPIRDCRGKHGTEESADVGSKPNLSLRRPNRGRYGLDAGDGIPCAFTDRIAHRVSPDRTHAGCGGCIANRVPAAFGPSAAKRGEP